MTNLRRTRVWIVLVGLLAGVLVAAASAISAFWTVLLTCGGDGGYPYAARDSTTGRVCEAFDESPAVLVAQLGVPVLATALVLSAAVRRARWSLLGVALATGLVLALVPALVIESLPDGCSPSDQRAFDAWARDGGRGTSPADCETY